MVEGMVVGTPLVFCNGKEMVVIRAGERTVFQSEYRREGRYVRDFPVHRRRIERIAGAPCGICGAKVNHQVVAKSHDDVHRESEDAGPVNPACLHVEYDESEIRGYICLVSTEINGADGLGGREHGIAQRRHIEHAPVLADDIHVVIEVGDEELLGLGIVVYAGHADIRQGIGITEGLVVGLRVVVEVVAGDKIHL